MSGHASINIKHKVSYKTSLCIEYPPHTIAAGCIYLASLFLTEQDESFKVQGPLWDQWFLSRMDDIEGK